MTYAPHDMFATSVPYPEYTNLGQLISNSVQM
jgi:hypothetical protein